MLKQRFATFKKISVPFSLRFYCMSLFVHSQSKTAKNLTFFTSDQLYTISTMPAFLEDVYF